jgi:UDP-glucose 4-epimerase
LCNSSKQSLNRIGNINGKNQFDFFEMDIRDQEALDQLFSRKRFNAVIHFAGLKAVGESNEKPLEYFDNNVGGSDNSL